MVVIERFLRVFSLFIIVLVGTLESYGQAPRFSFIGDTVQIRLSDSVLSEKFQIFKGNFSTKRDAQHLRPVLGDIQKTTAYFSFIPRVPFKHDTDYSFVSKDAVYVFRTPSSTGFETFEVVEVHPTATQLPANFLKWYVHFNTPVNPIKIYDHFSLLNAQGIPVERSVLDLGTPLLSEDGKTLTVWIEPGRQKRDLGPNRVLGPVLTEGQRYSLVISGDLKDTNGRKLNHPYKKMFSVLPPDRSQPYISQWMLTLPVVRTKKGLHIDFGEPMDFGSLKNAIQITTADGTDVKGTFTFADKAALFLPERLWQSGRYTLTCDSRIEDIAGNNLERLFDRDVTVEFDEPILQIDFEIK